MLYGKFIAIMIQGFLVGAGPCVFICAPILLPYIAGTQRSWRAGLKAAFIFGLTRLVIYTFMGGFVSYIGYYMFKLFFHRSWGMFLWILAGVFIITLGILMILGKGIRNPLCKKMQQQTVDNSTKSMIVLGIVIGFSPCLPLIAVLTEIMFLAKNLFQGLLFGFAFGIGTLISPLLLLGALAPVIPAKLFRSERAGKIFNALCGILLVGIGIYIVWKKF
jgi:sulfite exporter TauE/SafE